jgi:outer membrane protein assembly factor BamD (BamD/ComL family)
MFDLYRAGRNQDGARRELEEFIAADPKSPYAPAVKKKMEELKPKP